MVNEIAPRVHNSGHWTIEACAVSQFENHMRAVAGWPLGSTERHSDAEMVNLIGKEALDWQRLAAEPGACLHLYGKREARAGPQDGACHPAARKDRRLTADSPAARWIRCGVSHRGAMDMLTGTLLEAAPTRGATGSGRQLSCCLSLTAHRHLQHVNRTRGSHRLLVQVRDNNVDQALKALKKKMQREGIFREMKLRNYYEKPSEKRVREQAEAVRRARKLARKSAQREGLLPGKALSSPVRRARAAVRAHRRGRRRHWRASAQRRLRWRGGFGGEAAASAARLRRPSVISTSAMRRWPAAAPRGFVVRSALSSPRNPILQAVQRVVAVDIEIAVAAVGKGGKALGLVRQPRTARAPSRLGSRRRARRAGSVTGYAPGAMTLSVS